jgi:Predicted membrane protein (DUF2142)
VTAAVRLNREMSIRPVWWTYFFAFAVLAGAWAFAAPLFSGPDEGAHVERAAAVVRGDVIGQPRPTVFGTQMLVHVPEAYQRIAESACFYGRSDVTASCAPVFDGGRRLVAVLTYEFRNPPAYYAFVGLPTLIWTASTGVYLMRLLTAMLWAALMASAVVSARSMTHPKLMAIGILVASTPAALYFAGTVNPSSIEIAASTCSWAAGLALALGDDPVDGRLVTRFGVALTILATMRPLSPLFAALVVAAALGVAPRTRVRMLAGRAHVRRWLAIALGSALLATLWTALVALPNQVAFRSIGVMAAVRRTGEVFRQSVGVLGSLDVRLPGFVLSVWAVVALLGLLGALLTAGRQKAGVLVALIALALVLPVTSSGLGVPHVGFAWQGRFGLPLLAGIALLAFASARPDRLAVLAGWPVLALLGIAQVVAFITAGHRYGVGEGNRRALLSYIEHSSWRPPILPLALLIAFVVAVVGLIVVTATCPEEPGQVSQLGEGAKAGGMAPEGGDDGVDQGVAAVEVQPAGPDVVARAEAKFCAEGT